MSSNIEWTDVTWNPVVGCTKVSSGCANCYAETMSNRLAGMARADQAKAAAAEGHHPVRTGADADGSRKSGAGASKKHHYLHVINDRGRFNGVVRCVPEVLAAPLKWRTPRRVFVNSMSDLFHEGVPFEHVDKVFAVMAIAQRHTFQILTKRPERMAEYLASRDRERGEHREKVWNAKVAMQGKPVTPMDWPLPNVWLGASCEDQPAADKRVGHLLRCPALVRFLSLEPLLGELDIGFEKAALTDMMDASGQRDERFKGTYPFRGMPADAVTRRKHMIDWVIVGGESGRGARPCDVAWIRSIVRQCKAAGVPCFVKQLGAEVRDSAGNVLDGRWPAGTDWCAEQPRYADPQEVSRSDEPCVVRLTSSNGGDMSEWPEDLKVREWPAAFGMPCRGSAPGTPAGGKP